MLKLEQKQCTSSKQKEVAHLTNLDIGKTYIVRTYENDRDTGKQRLQVQEKKIATSHEMEVEFELSSIRRNNRSLVGIRWKKYLMSKGNILSSSFDWNNDH